MNKMFELGYNGTIIHIFVVDDVVMYKAKDIIYMLQFLDYQEVMDLCCREIKYFSKEESKRKFGYNHSMKLISEKDFEKLKSISDFNDVEFYSLLLDKVNEIKEEVFSDTKEIELSDGIQEFSRDNFGKVRIIIKDGEPWFVAKDIAVALNYPKSSINQINNLFSNVPVEWTDHNQIMVRSNNGISQSRKMLFVSEQGLYFFLGRSDKPKALPYQMWIAEKVVPSIRKTGKYSIDDDDTNDTDNLIDKFKALSVENRLRMEIFATKEILTLANVDINNIAISVNRIAKEYIGRDILAESNIELIAKVQEPHFTPTEIGERYEVSAQKVNSILKNRGYQKKVCNQWVATDKGKKYSIVLDTGKRQGTGTPVTQLKWKQSIFDILDEIFTDEDED